MRKKQSKFCLGVWNCDTESSIEGYMSAFMANRWHSRLAMRRPVSNSHRSGPSGVYLKNIARIEKLIESTGETYRTTQQKEVRDFFKMLQDTAERVEEILLTMDKGLKPDAIKVYWIIHFANIEWDLDVIKGIIFDGSYNYDCVGQQSDLVQFTYGHLQFRDFLRLTAFRSVRMAGLVCMSAKKQDGSEVYKLRREDIPERYEDYPANIRDYMENDVAVMDESLNTIINRRENRTIEYLEDLPMTSTGFGRWRFTHNPEIIMENGNPVNVSALLTMSRWRYARPLLPYLMRAYKGGYCGPNPNVQFKILKNIVCFDAVSMYPDKMLFHEMMQCTKYTKVLECPYTLEECAVLQDLIYECKSALFRITNIYEYIETLDEDGLTTIKADDHARGICPWIGTVRLNIYGVREKNGARMMPFLSEEKVENINKKRKPVPGTATNVITINGKLMQGENVRCILTSVDLMLLILCYDCEILQLEKWITMSWKPMLPVQKRDLWEAYKRKMHISRVIKRDRYSNDDYWRDECGFPPELVNGMEESEYRIFCKAYKELTKTDPNGKYGMTVEKPIHPKTIVKQTDDGHPVLDTESIAEMRTRLLTDLEGSTPNYVKASDYCAGSSITMWARWQLIMMMHCLFLKGIETAYSDTDSLFVKDSDAARECFTKFNARKKELYWSTVISDHETVTVDDAEGLGQFELDKECDIFRTLGAKNYGYIHKGKVKLTIAGLRTTDYERFIQKEIDERKDALSVFRERYRANVCIHPDACHKLLKDTSNCGYDEQGLWRGPVLMEVGFFLDDANSKFHINNMIQCANLQELGTDYYIGLFHRRMDVTAKGFSFMSKPNQEELIQDYSIIDDRQPIQGGMV